jgi:uncharacterized protein (DUF362 family)
MIATISKDEKINILFNTPWIKSVIEKKCKVIIKINLAGLPEKNHPRTDSQLLENVIHFFLDMGFMITICESADGYLSMNLCSIGLDWMTQSKFIQIIDLDEQEYFNVDTNGQKISIPNYLKTNDLKISIPCTSKRENMLFTNNIKNFFGATPRVEYLRTGQGRWRSTLHDELTKSVINVYKSFENHAKFDLYINGGNSYRECDGSFNFDKVFISNSAIELDQHIFDRYFSNAAMPEYLIQIQKKFTA